MGSPATQKDRGDNEGPQHEVTIAKPFALSRLNVTFADWDACFAVGGCRHVSESDMGRGTKPVINITWEDAQTYVAWLSKMTGQPYRLPTEAEWEYAARAGTTSAYYWGEEIGAGNANCNGCGGKWDNKESSPIGSFAANPFGILDMAGNVFQWTQDCYHEDYAGAPTDGSAWLSGNCSIRVIRGGSWEASHPTLSSAARDKYSIDNRDYAQGFRIARDLAH